MFNAPRFMSWRILGGALLLHAVKSSFSEAGILGLIRNTDVWGITQKILLPAPVPSVSFLLPTVSE